MWIWGLDSHDRFWVFCAYFHIVSGREEWLPLALIYHLTMRWSRVSAPQVFDPGFGPRFRTRGVQKQGFGTPPRGGSRIWGFLGAPEVQTRRGEGNFLGLNSD
jgi:hypothetical protein